MDVQKSRDELPLLAILKKSKKIPMVGDIFVMKRKDINKYLYGLVVEDKCAGPMAPEELLIVYIYKYQTDTITPIPVLNKSDILILPEIVGYHGWNAGYFLTVGTIPKDKIDKIARHSFFDPISKNDKGEGNYLDEFGNVIGFGNERTSKICYEQPLYG